MIVLVVAEVPVWVSNAGPVIVFEVSGPGGSPIQIERQAGATVHHQIRPKIIAFAVVVDVGINDTKVWNCFNNGCGLHSRRPSPIP